MKFVEHKNLRERSVEHRLYQERILGTAVQGNTIVVAPTALGKTIVAILLAAKRLEKGRVVVAAPTKPLAQQHRESFSEHLKVEEVIALDGSVPPSKRKESWEKRVVCCTPQTLRNDLLRGRTDLKDVSLLVVDESHRAVGNYAYVYLAKRYMSEADDPLILALTASPGATKSKISKICKNLFIENVEVRTDSSKDVKEYVNPVKIDWMEVELPDSYISLRDKIKDLLREDLLALRPFGLNARNLDRVSVKAILSLKGKLASRLRSHPENYKALSIAARCMKLMHAKNLLETQGITSLREYFKRLKKDKTKAAKALLSNPKFKSVVLNASHYEVDHPKLTKLIAILKKSEGQAIVFSHYRDQVDLIVRRLEEEGISVHPFIGQTEGMSQKEQRRVLREFRDGGFRVLVSTSVGEEGLDIPSVDLVVFYEPVPSAVRTIQRRGRTGRKNEGRVIVLIAKGTRDEAYFWSAYHKERRMAKELKSIGDVETEQRSLEIPSDRPFLIADTREIGKGAVEKISRVDVQTHQLEVADYLLSPRVAVERKTADDFASSLIDGRLMNQALELSRNFSHPLFVVEGDIYTARNIHPNAINGALAAITIDFGIPILFTQSPEETAHLLEIISIRESKSHGPPDIKASKRAVTTKEFQERLVAMLPSVNVVLARRLLSRFKTLEQLFSASEEELVEVEGIGEKKAEEIRKVASEEYDS